MPQGKNILIASIVVVAVIVLVVFGFMKKPSPAPTQDQNPPNTSSENTASSVPKTPPPPITQTKTPPNVVVPEENSKNVPANVAKPENVSVLNSDAGTKFRTFKISAAGNQFTPNTMIVKAGDVLKIEFTAVDKSYDFTQPNYGIRPFSTEKGKTRILNFQAGGLGKFTFYCTLCGGPTKGPVGYLIVTQ
ncbi:MAG: hypothetical protein HY093_00225 [Candidatus Liptonbacteria bacterium]|nr:hypothetical protein [Candidatus Liptonbacteria bacterium]